jgi:Zn-finger nucleic acid-binding protein/ribosomal protein L40E
VSNAPHGDDRPFDAPTAPALKCPSCGAPVLEADRACGYCGSLLSTRRCLSCFALNPRDALKCGRCGATLPSETLRPVAASRCPDCRVDLVTRAAAAVGYAECARCGGLFLKPDAFQAVTRDADVRARLRAVETAPVTTTAARLGDRVRYRPCPSCGRLMNRTNYAGGSGIILDVCRDHGVWFDRGELTAIVDFLEKGGWDRIRKRERDRLDEEVRSLENRKTASGLGGTLGPVLDAPARTFDMFELLSWLGSLVFKK